MVGDAFRHVQSRLGRAAWDIRWDTGGEFHLTVLCVLMLGSSRCERWIDRIGYDNEIAKVEWRGPFARAAHQASSRVMVRHNN